MCGKADLNNLAQTRMIRALFVVTGLVLIAVAFISAGRVADTREGLIAEVITLLAGLAGVALLLYGLIPRRSASAPPPIATARGIKTRRRTANDLVIGTAGMVIALVLLGGLAYSGGWGWAALGAVLLIPMIAGSGYLVMAFARAPERDWKVDLQRLFRSRGDD